MRTDAMAIQVSSPGHLLLEAKPTEPPGYKNTVVGIIPSDWNLATIGELIENNNILGHLDGNHGELYPRSHEFRSYGVPYVGANDFHNGKVSFGHCKFLTEERAALFRKGVAKDGDVLFAHNATVGPVALVETKLPLIILSTTATYFRCNTDLLNNLYLKAVLQAPYFINQYKAVMAQSTRFQVPITAQRKFTIAVPSIREQRAIATALSDVDALLEELDNLIAKKRFLKQATMQQLLTGQTRLTGFEGEWTGKPMGDLADIDPENLTSGTDHSYRFNYISLEQIDCGRLIGVTEVTYASAPSRARRVLRHDDVLVSTVRPNLMSHLLFKSEVSDAVCSTGFAVLRANLKVTSPGFLFFHLFHHPVNRQIEKIIAGSNYPAINSGDVRKIEIPCPPTVEEQSAIAAVIWDMDVEIQALEQRRNKTAALKQAMMQELLTGRTRLI